MMMRGAVGQDASLEYVSEASTSVATGIGGSHTFSGMDFGAPASTRLVVVAAHVRVDAVGTPVFTTFTIGGVAATVVNSYASGNLTAIAYASVPAGTSGDIVVASATVSLYRGLIHVYRMTGRVFSASAVAVGSGTGATVTAVTGGAVVAASGVRATSPSECTWSANVTEQMETSVASAAELSSAIAVDTPGGSLTVTPTWTVQTATSSQVVVSFG